MTQEMIQGDCVAEMRKFPEATRQFASARTKVEDDLHLKVSSKIQSV